MSALPPLSQLQQLASGRRIVNMCMFIGIAAGAFQISKTSFAVFVYLGLSLVAIVGTLRLSKGFSFSLAKATLMAIGSVIPFVGYLVMAWLSFRAAALLKAAGYSVGLFQATN